MDFCYNNHKIFLRANYKIKQVNLLPLKVIHRKNKL